MNTIYMILYRTDPEWDGQYIYQTNSKALFDFISSLHYNRDNVYFDGFSSELKVEIEAAHNKRMAEYAIDEHENLEDLGISDAMEYLESNEKFPVIVAGTTEITARWNW